MRKIIVFQNEIFEIAKIIKTKFSNKKIRVYKTPQEVIIKIPKDTDYFQIEELRVFLKTRYPHLKINFQYFV